MRREGVGGWRDVEMLEVTNLYLYLKRRQHKHGERVNATKEERGGSRSGRTWEGGIFKYFETSWQSRRCLASD